MEDLPVEVIAHILTYLPSIKDRKACSLVCRSWYEAYQDPLFRHTELLCIDKETKFQELTQLANSNRKYLNLMVKEIEVSDRSLDFWKRYGPHLRSLAIVGCDIREKFFFKVLEMCTQLESLCLQNCRELFMVGHLLEDDSIKSILKERLVSLNNLNLSYNRYLSDAIFTQFASVFPEIVELTLAGCPISFFSGLYKRFYPDGQTSPSGSILTFPFILNYLKKNVRSLKHLSFKETSIDNAALSHLSQLPDLTLKSLDLRGCHQLSQGGIAALSNCQHSLTELDVSVCPRITDASLMAICSGLTNLESLAVQNCRGITDLGISCLHQLTKLKSLNISECDLIQGEGILTGICHRVNPNFKDLHLSHLANVTENVVLSLSECLPNLRTLDLGFCYNAVTNKSVQAVIQNNCRLETLILAMCEKLTDSGLTGLNTKSNLIESDSPSPSCYKMPLGSKAEQEIVKEAKMQREMREMYKSSPVEGGVSLKNLKRLRHLNLFGCNGLTDLSLIYAIQLPELIHLNLSYCNGVTADGLKHLSMNNRALEYLNLDLCHNVTDEGVRHVVENFKRLDTLILGSVKITDSVADIFVEHAGDLHHLNMMYCNRVSSSALDRIEAGLPHLHNVLYTRYLSDVSSPAPPFPKQ